LLAASLVGMRWPELHRAVVISPHATAFIAPASSAAAAFELKPGEVVRAEQTYGQFVQVRASDGRAGWLPDSAIESIILPAS